jgi:hypothetical protein
MTEPPTMHDPPLGVGLTSVVLGSLGLALFFLPVLSIPLGGLGLTFGLVGLLLALVRGGTSLRWAIGGVVLSGLALSVSLAIAKAPTGFLPARIMPLDLQPLPERPYVAPPARPRTVAVVPWQKPSRRGRRCWDEPSLRSALTLRR